VRVVGDWLMDSWGLWYPVVVEVGCMGCVVAMVVGCAGYGCLAGVVEVGWHRGVASGPTVDLVVALADEGYLLHIAILPVSRALCLCVVSEL
jgi:hypothetical protein